jgi:hypothetical protein
MPKPDHARPSEPRAERVELVRLVRRIQALTLELQEPRQRELDQADAAMSVLQATTVKAERASKEDSVRTRLSIDVPPTQSAAAPKELTLTFDELALIYKSLQAVKTLGALPSEDELFDDTIQLVDQALNDAVR